MRSWPPSCCPSARPPPPPLPPGRVGPGPTAPTAGAAATQSTPPRAPTTALPQADAPATRTRVRTAAHEWSLIPVNPPTRLHYRSAINWRKSTMVDSTLHPPAPPPVGLKGALPRRLERGQKSVGLDHHIVRTAHDQKATYGRHMRPAPNRHHLRPVPTWPWRCGRQREGEGDHVALGCRLRSGRAIMGAA